MPLRDVVLYDDDRIEWCERAVCMMLAYTLDVAKFRQYEIAAHHHAIREARDHLTKLLDKVGDSHE